MSKIINNFNSLQPRNSWIGFKHNHQNKHNHPPHINHSIIRVYLLFIIVYFCIFMFKKSLFFQYNWLFIFHPYYYNRLLIYYLLTNLLSTIQLTASSRMLKQSIHLNTLVTCICIKWAWYCSRLPRATWQELQWNWRLATALISQVLDAIAAWIGFEGRLV